MSTAADLRLAREIAVLAGRNREGFFGAQGVIVTLIDALKPIAAFAEPSRRIPGHHVITQGSPMARRQLTMGDCYTAADALAAAERLASAGEAGS